MRRTAACGPPRQGKPWERTWELSTDEVGRLLVRPLPTVKRRAPNEPELSANSLAVIPEPAPGPLFDGFACRRNAGSCGGPQPLAGQVRSVRTRGIWS